MVFKKFRDFWYDELHFYRINLTALKKPPQIKEYIADFGKKMKTNKLSDNFKYSIETIILKDIAGKLRKEYPNLRIEAHPGIVPTLFIGKKDKKRSIKIFLPKYTRFLQIKPIDNNEYVARVVSNTISRKCLDTFIEKENIDDFIRLNLIQPDSLDQLWKWMFTITKIV